VSADTYCDTLNYIICDNEAVITGFDGEPENICIPGMIEGKTVTEIRENAFYKCDSLKNVIIPESVEKIGHHAFFGCTSLETAVIEGKIHSVEEGSFFDCSSMKSVELPDTLKTIEKYAFYNCCNIREIDVPDSVTSIREYAFTDCKMLENIELSSNLYELDDFAFLRCSSLNSINIPDSIISVGSYAMGYEGDGLFIPVSSFTVFGSENSLGRAYADENGVRFVNSEKTTEKNERNFPVIPTLMVIISGIGLIFFRWTKKMLLLDNTYEYEQ
ncbi:MAG: leucine-rich repeat domain-containing protein, partial [Oscillospiraceae bacterium]|nr:leucine-rich repeat domain-containing protein [Oscillospiraceae bacterium]